MSKRPTRGLTLGKYAPLHKGHQLVIETGLAEMDEMIVLIYDSPHVTNVPLAVRANWLRQLYPAAKIIEAWGGPTEVGYTADIMRAHERYILHELDIGNITHFYSSEPYGQHMSVALGAEDRRIDVERQQIPISGTAIRSDPYGQRAFIDPLVYRDLITNVVFLGAPSSGKTTLAERLAAEYQTVWMPEYGREYWENNQIERRLSPDQLVEIAEGHLEREEKLLARANRILFTDTNALTTATFARYYHGHIRPKLSQLAQHTAMRYDVCFVCDIDIPYDDTWDRSGEVKRQEFQRQVIQDLHRYNIPYYVLQGSLPERMAQVRELLGRYQKFDNPADLFTR